MITDKGLSIPYLDFLNKCNNDKNNLNKILKHFTVKEVYTKGKPKGLPLVIKRAYMFIDNNIIFPRIKLSKFIERKFIDNIIINYVNEPKKNKKHEILIPLYDYQKSILIYLLKNIFNEENIINHKSICYLQMDTGLGKTRIGCSLINNIGYSALIVVPTLSIGYQWIEECNEIYPDIKIKFYNNSLKDKPTAYNNEITIVTVNTFYKKNISFIEGYGIIIYDEAHEYYSNQFSKILWLAQSKIVLGLSATPLDRNNQLDKYVTLHLGDPIYAKDISQISNINFKVNVKCINYRGDPNYIETVTTKNGTISTILTINNISQDNSRIKLIIDETIRLYNDNHGIFIFAEYRNFLDIIKNNLLKTNIDINNIISIYNDEDISILRGGVSKEYFLKTKSKGSHIVLTTYGYSRRGISLINMTAMILATPRKSGIKQIIGRILRKGSDENIIREIVDIIDINSILKTQFKERYKIYLEKKYKIFFDNVNYDIKYNNSINDNSNVDNSITTNDNDDNINNKYNKLIDLLYQ